MNGASAIGDAAENADTDGVQFVTLPRLKFEPRRAIDPKLRMLTPQVVAHEAYPAVRLRADREVFAALRSTKRRGLFRWAGTGVFQEYGKGGRDYAWPAELVLHRNRIEALVDLMDTRGGGLYFLGTVLCFPGGAWQTSVGLGWCVDADRPTAGGLVAVRRYVCCRGGEEPAKVVLERDLTRAFTPGIWAHLAGRTPTIDWVAEHAEEQERKRGAGRCRKR